MAYECPVENEQPQVCPLCGADADKDACRLPYMNQEIADEIERLQVQLAGCAVAAVHDETPPLKRDAYGWSASYQEVIDNRHKAEARIAELAAALEQIKKPYPGRDATASIKVMRGIATKALASDGSAATDVLKAAVALNDFETGDKDVSSVIPYWEALREAVARWKGEA